MSDSSTAASATATPNSIPNPATLPTPHMTQGNSDIYIERAALAAANASIHDPVTQHFQREKQDILPADAPISQVHSALYTSNIARLKDLISKGAIIAEAADFTAVACWSPPSTSPSTSTTQSTQTTELQSLSNPPRKLITHYLTSNERSKSHYLYPHYGHRYWHLSLMGRDPTRTHVPGAVRAVVDPFIARAREEEVPIWLCAGSHHARDVYKHFGFRALDTFVIGDVELTCMMLEPLLCD